MPISRFIVTLAFSFLALPLVSVAQSPAVTDDTTSATNIYCPHLSTTFKKGYRDKNTNGQVSELQQFLSDYYSVEPTQLISGFFGNTTNGYVKRFQSEQNLPPLGVVGSLTRAAIANVCSTGSDTTATSSMPTTISPAPLQCPAVTPPSCTGTLSRSYDPHGCAFYVCTAVDATCSPEPSSPQTQTLSCPSGQTGAIVQTRASSCPGPTWSPWLTSKNTCATAVNNPIDVFLIAGQSNATGNNGTYDGSAASPQITPGTALQYFDGALSSANDPIGYAHIGSAWPQFAVTYYQKTGHKIAFVAASSNGSTLFQQDQYAPEGGGGGGNWSTTGSLFAESVANANTGLAALTSAGYTPALKGVLWIQGEGDAQSMPQPITQSQYETALQALIQRFRDNLGQSALPFYIFQIGTNSAYYPNDNGYGNVRSAQNNVDLPSSRIYVVSRNALGFVNTGRMADTVHYNQAGYNDIGQVAAQNVALYQTGNTSVPVSDTIGSIGVDSGNPLTIHFGGYINHVNSCAASTDAISYGDGSADDISIGVNMCAPIFFQTSHTYAKPGTYPLQLDTTSVASHHAGNPYSILNSTSYTIASGSPIPAPTCALNFSPAIAPVGQTVGLYWSGYNIIAASINQGIGGSLQLSGGTNVIVASSPTTYTLTVTGKDGSTKQCQATI